MGASWVEALGKSHELDVFQQCVIQKATNINADGKTEIIILPPGFGIKLDEVKLKALADNFVQLY